MNMPEEWFGVTLKVQVHDVFIMNNLSRLGKKVFSNSVVQKQIPDTFLMVNSGRKLVSTNLAHIQLP